MGLNILITELYITNTPPTSKIVVVIILPIMEYFIYPYVYFLLAFFLLIFSNIYDNPILKASPKSCNASDDIATEPVNIPPKNSNIENDKLSKNAISIFLSVFMFPAFIKIIAHYFLLLTILNNFFKYFSPL